MVFRHTSLGSRKPHSTDNPLVRLGGLEIKCCMFGVLCLNLRPAQYGQVKHSREGYPSLFSCKSSSSFLMLLLPPYMLCPAPSSSEQLFQKHKRCLCARPPGPSPTDTEGSRGSSSTAPLQGATRSRGTHQLQNAPDAGLSGAYRQTDRQRLTMKREQGDAKIATAEQ